MSTTPYYYDQRLDRMNWKRETWCPGCEQNSLKIEVKEGFRCPNCNVVFTSEQLHDVFLKRAKARGVETRQERVADEDLFLDANLPIGKTSVKDIKKAFEDAGGVCGNNKAKEIRQRKGWASTKRGKTPAITEEVRTKILEMRAREPQPSWGEIGKELDLSIDTLKSWWSKQ